MEAGRRWALEMFGPPGPTIRRRVPGLVRQEHDRAVASQDAWEHDAQFAYGNFWWGIIRAFQEFQRLEGGSLMRPGNAPYKLPVVNGTTIFPWRYARTADAEVGTTPFATSPARIAIPALRQRTVQSPLLKDFAEPLDLTEDDEKVLETLEAVKRDPNTNNRLVLVAVASSMRGLHVVNWGEMTLSEDGYPEQVGFWESRMRTPISKPVSTNLGTSFTDGTQPRRRVEIRRDDKQSQADE